MEEGKPQTPSGDVRPPPQDPRRSRLAEWVFKAIVHCPLSDYLRSGGPAPQPIPMVPNNRNWPASPISADPSSLSSSVPNTLLSYPWSPTPSLTPSPSIFIPVGLTHRRSLCFPDHNPQGMVCTTVRPRVLIQEVVAHVRKLLKQSGNDPKAKPLCFSVRPEDGSQHRWETPTDWNGTESHDHYGSTFRISVPVSVCYGTWRLFSQILPTN